MYQKIGRFCADSHIGAELEDMISSSFIDGIFDEESIVEELGYDFNNHVMFCLSLRDGSYDGPPAGVIFWRELDATTMRNWIIPPAKAKSSLIQFNTIQHLDDTNPFSPVETVSYPTSNNDELFRRWIKIELVATHPHYVGNGLGSRLLATALLTALTRANNKCILHVAGGEKNIPATKLYRDFGFHPVPKSSFNSPNNDIFVLVDIAQALQQNVDWSKMQITLKNNIPSNDNARLKVVDVSDTAASSVPSIGRVNSDTCHTTISDYHAER